MPVPGIHKVILNIRCKKNSPINTKKYGGNIRRDLLRKNHLILFPAGTEASSFESRRFRVIRNPEMVKKRSTPYCPNCKAFCESPLSMAQWPETVDRMATNRRAFMCGKYFLFSMIHQQNLNQNTFYFKTTSIHSAYFALKDK